MKHVVYEAIPRLGRQRAIREIESGFTDRVIRALLSLATYDSDRCWVQKICVKQSKSLDESVRGIAVLCFGHLARIHGTLEMGSAIRALLGALEDSSDYVRGQAVTALDDILTFCVAQRYDRTAAISQLESLRLDDVLLALAAIVKHDQDAQFALAKCLEYSTHPNEVVRGQALRGLATLVWDHKHLDLEAAIPILTEAAKTPGYAGECAANALESINTYLEG